MPVSLPDPTDNRLQAAQTLLAPSRAMPSGLALLLAIAALVVSGLMLAFLLTIGPKAIAKPAAAAPKADFQLSGSAFPDERSDKSLPSGSESSH